MIYTVQPCSQMGNHNEWMDGTGYTFSLYVTLIISVVFWTSIKSAVSPWTDNMAIAFYLSEVY